MFTDIRTDEGDSMQYMLLIYNDRPVGEPSAADAQEMMPAYMAYTEELQKRGAMVGGARLFAPDSATTVRERDGKRVITDGPFAETKEWLGGYYLIEAASLDDALAAASMCPGTKFGSVEIRPVAPAGG